MNEARRNLELSRLELRISGVIGRWVMDERNRVRCAPGAILELGNAIHECIRVSGQRGTSEASGSGVSPNGTPDARDRDEGAGTPK